jgi:hypothetical protein
LNSCLIGITQPDNSYSARPLLLGDDPDHLVTLLRQLHHDADGWAGLVPQLLEHTLGQLSTTARHDRNDPTAVPGIGYTAPDDGCAHVDARITDLVPCDLNWLYLNDTATDTVVVYEATRHDRWLLHSRHDLNQHRDHQQTDAPLTHVPSLRVVTRQSTAPLAHLSMGASHRYVEDLTNGIRRGSIVLDPPYQRGSVWTGDQRIALMKSWLMGVPVAAITLNNRMGSAWHATDPQSRTPYAVIDGKQRLETPLGWEDGDLTIPASWLPAQWIDTTDNTTDGPYVRRTGLTVTGALRVHDQMTLPCVQAHLPDVTAEAELYLLVNGGGTPQSKPDTDITNATHIAGR